jgi:DNA-binding IclR family transcriptional regulator
MNDAADRYRAPALDKGLDILELLSTQPQGLTRAEIVKAMGRSPSEIYRMLERLVARSYVSRSPEGDRHALSLKLYVLAHRYPPLERLVQRAMPHLDAFSKAAEQSCHLGVYDRGNVTVVAQVQSPAHWGLSIRLGVQVSLVGTGSGHVLLAHQSDERRKTMLQEHRALEGEVMKSARSLDTLHHGIRERGYWQGASEQAQGVTDISCPVIGPEGEALAALTCPYLMRIDQRSTADIGQTRQLLLDAAAAISVR